jgi:hypothetical protein
MSAELAQFDTLLGIPMDTGIFDTVEFGTSIPPASAEPQPDDDFQMNTQPGDCPPELDDYRPSTTVSAELAQVDALLGPHMDTGIFDTVELGASIPPASAEPQPDDFLQMNTQPGDASLEPDDYRPFPTVSAEPTQVDSLLGPQMGTGILDNVELGTSPPPASVELKPDEELQGAQINTGIISDTIEPGASLPASSVELRPDDTRKYPAWTSEMSP